MHSPDRSYEMYGYYEFTGNMSANSLRSGLKGPNNIKFADGQHIRFKSADFKLCGTVVGERTIEADGSLVFEDLTNNRKAVIIFSTYKKSGFWSTVETGKKDEYVGMIYDCTPIDKEQSFKNIYGKSPEEITDLSYLRDVAKPICELSGSWLRNLTIDNKKYWDIDEDVPTRQIP